MSAKDGDRPDKWSDAPDGEVGGLFRSARHLAGLDQAGLASVQRRLAHETQPVRHWRPAFAVALILILGSGLTALARVGWQRLRQAAPTSSRIERSGHAPTTERQVPSPDTPGALDPPAINQTPTPTPPPPPGRKHARAHVAPGGPAEREPRISPEPSAVAEEARALAVAIEALRARQPARALSALDEYQRKFAAGHLVDEAAVLRVDATLALGRRRDALAVLDHLSIAALPRSRELFVLRAQLRAENERCAEAEADLRNVALGPGTAGSLTARAAAIRAECDRIRGAP